MQHWEIMNKSGKLANYYFRTFVHQELKKYTTNNFDDDDDLGFRARRR